MYLTWVFVFVRRENSSAGVSLRYHVLCGVNLVVLSLLVSSWQHTSICCLLMLVCIDDSGCPQNFPHARPAQWCSFSVCRLVWQQQVLTAGTVLVAVSSSCQCCCTDHLLSLTVPLFSPGQLFLLWVLWWGQAGIHILVFVVYLFLWTCLLM